jgi:outer membrane receptor protein involved in Fe transport
VGNYGDENYTVTLEFTPTDNFSWRLRGNERSYRRRMGAAGQTAGIIALSEFGGLDRDTQSEVFGFREILSSNTNPAVSSFDPSLGSDALAASGLAGLNLTDPTQPNFVNTSASPLNTNGLSDLFSFTNPYNGETVLAQRLRPGVDVAADDEPSRNFGCAGDASCVLAPVRDPDGLSGSELDTATNNRQDEFFDHQAAYSTMELDVNDMLSVKYVFGYTDYFYDRTSDRDLTSNVNSGETFYVSQENENFQHEFQFLFDFGERATLTSGIYFYEARITQRGDFFSELGERRYTQPADYDPLTAAALGALFPGEASLFTAKGNFNALDADAQAALVNSEAITTGVSLWQGDTAANPGGCTSLTSGPVTCGSFVEYQTENRTEAFAFYNQAELFLTDQFSLTLGIRYAEDERSGEENVFIYTESVPTFAGVASGNIGLGEVLALSALDSGDGATSALGPGALPITPTGSLLQYNIATGAIDPDTLQQTGNAITRYRGVPFGVSFYRPVEETYDAWTWRANLDWEPNETTLIYAGITTGYRAGGFNLANLSAQPVYDQEEITAYEIGWKDQLFDRSLQVNASVYYYDYENVHQAFSGFSNSLGAVVDNVAAVPSAEIFGFEADLFWLATDRITLGGNFSFTDSEYTSELLGTLDTDSDGVGDTVGSVVTDAFNSAAPDSLFGGVTERPVSIDGNQMLLIPEIKWTVFGMYNIPLGNRGNVELRTNVSYTDEVFFSIENNPVDKAPEYYRWDARVSWTSANEAFIVSGFVNNILNDIGIRQIARYGENQNYLRTATPTDPRLMGLEFTWNFGAFN